MRILGIDPSLSSTGWAIVEGKHVVASGTIKTSPKNDFLVRLNMIDNTINNLFLSREYPNLVAIEDIFVYKGKSLQTPIKIAKVHGVIISRVLSFMTTDGIKIYAPTVVKQVVTGSGRADKDQVMKMVKLQTDYKGKSNDEADAIATALTCMREL
jgi:crossover junction endodeoxyribonuclease RuvC